MVQKSLWLTNNQAKRIVIGICGTTSNSQCTNQTLYGAPIMATDETTTSVEIDLKITAATYNQISYIITGIYVNTNNNNNNTPIPSSTSYTFTSTTSTGCTGLLTNISFGTGTYFADPSGNLVPLNLFYNGTLPLTQTSNEPTIYQNNSDGTPIIYTQNLDPELPSGSYSCNFYYSQNSDYTPCVVETTSIGSINTFSFTVS